ncbi:MAG: hypothetical protein U1D35_16100 [Paracoccaceae bacterium]|nr:hypothetical protein [Paracoccaceae bacterium]
MTALASNPDGFTVRFTDEEWGRLELMTGEIPHLLSNAGDVFELLHRGFSTGFLDACPGVISLLELCARAMKSAAETEGEAVAYLDQKLRNAMGDRIAADRTKRKGQCQ